MRAAIGLGSIALVFGVCSHLLGESVRESRPTAPQKGWSDADDAAMVEAAHKFATTPTTSPFGYEH